MVCGFVCGGGCAPAPTEPRTKGWVAVCMCGCVCRSRSQPAPRGRGLAVPCCLPPCGSRASLSLVRLSVLAVGCGWFSHRAAHACAHTCTHMRLAFPLNTESHRCTRTAVAPTCLPSAGVGESAAPYGTLPTCLNPVPSHANLPQPCPIAFQPASTLSHRIPTCLNPVPSHPIASLHPRDAQVALTNCGFYTGEDDMRWWQFGDTTLTALKFYQVCAGCNNCAIR